MFLMHCSQIISCSSPRKFYPAPHSGAPQGQMVRAVAQLVSSMWSREEEESGLSPPSLNLSSKDRELLERGICSYLLPGHQALQRGDISTPLSESACMMERCVSAEILKVCYVPHVCPAETSSVLKVPCARLPKYCTLWFSTGMQRETCRSRGFHGLQRRV